MVDARTLDLTAEVGDTVQVTWFDHASTDGWCKLAEVNDEPQRMSTIGILVTVSDEVLVVASTYRCDESSKIVSDGLVCNVMTIIRSSVLSVEILKPLTRKSRKSPHAKA